MTDANKPKIPELILIQGGRTTAQEFIQLPFPDKISRLRMSPAKRRNELILSDPEGERLRG